jgi:hypothetical protein
MPPKTDKPKIKVEEITEETPKEEKPEEESEDGTPKISSFSQLDSMKSSDKANMEKEEEKEPEKKLEESEPKSEVPETPQEEPPEEEKSESEEKMSSENVKDWLKDIRPDTTKDVEKGGGFNFKLFFIFVVIFALLGALVGGIFYYKQNVSMQAPSGEKTTTTEVTLTPTATPTSEATLDLTKYSVNILNGSGIKGEAGKVEELLISAGFAEDKVTTGNANSYDYTTTSVSLKKDIPDEVFGKVKTALGSGYTVEKAVATLSDSSSYDIEIIVGNSK